MMNLRSRLFIFAITTLVVLSKESRLTKRRLKKGKKEDIKICLDDTTFRYRNNNKRSCTFIGKEKSRSKRLCKKSAVENSCPVTCKICKATAINAELSTEAPKERPKRPNILIILADDVGTGDIPFYWNTGLVDMPNIQRLADMGVTFTNAHSTPLCAPSRYSLLSGNYPHRGAEKMGSWGIGASSEVSDSKRLESQFLPNQKSIAAVLRDSGGYNTYMSGKYHLGGQVPLKEGATFNDTHFLSAKGHDWSKPIIGGPQDLGFGDSLITPSGIQASPYSFFQDGYLIMDANDAVYWREGSYDMNMGTSIINSKKEGEGSPDWDSSAYNQILVNDTARFIDSHLQGDKSDDPMFMYVALGAVHSPHSPPNQYMNNEPVAGVNPTVHMDMLMEIDLVVGSLVSMIEDKGLASDTIIMFTSDNGGLGENATDSLEFHHFPSGVLRGSKKQIYEGGHRVPMIVRHDGTYPSNEKRSKLVGLNDVYATLCEIAGVDIPDDGVSAQDSISFAPYITSANNVEGLRTGQSTWTPRKKDNAQDESWQNNRWKVIRQLYKHGDGTFSSSVELYDLKNDISEAYDLSNDDRYNWRIESMLDSVRSDGPCPKDVKGKFKLTEGPQVGARKDCHWFEADRKRCEKYPSDGETFCSSVCGRFRGDCNDAGYYWLDEHGW